MAPALVPLMMLLIKAVNRIPFRKSATGGSFHRWIDDDLAPLIGA